MLYKVLRDDYGFVACIAVEGESERPVRHIARHSPTGMETGYGGSGPADLALSILVDYFAHHPARTKSMSLEAAEKQAWTFHQDFKWAFIASLDRRLRPGQSYEISATEIDGWLRQ